MKNLHLAIVILIAIVAVAVITSSVAYGIKEEFKEKAAAVKTEAYAQGYQDGYSAGNVENSERLHEMSGEIKGGQ